MKKYLIIRSDGAGLIRRDIVETELNPVDFIKDYFSDEEDGDFYDFDLDEVTFLDGVTEYYREDDRERLIMVDIESFVK